jgi:transcriptional regulator GlxA family with amidase domain
MSRRAVRPLPALLSSQAEGVLPSQRNPWEMDPRIQGILEAMGSYCGEPLTVHGMAARLGLSRSRLEHLFREQTGLPFRATLLDFRLAKAATLLADWSRRIKEIASLCGYSSTASFTKAFRRQFGKSPSDYRHSTFGQKTAHPDNRLKLTA